MVIIRSLLSLLLPIVAFTSGCAILEKAILVPEVHSSVPFETDLINIEVINAVALAVKDVVQIHSWHKEVTYLDVLGGILETGYFRKPNIATIRLRVQIERDNKLIAITVKGSGPYYSKLPIESGHQAFQEAVTNRLAEAARIKKVARCCPTHHST